MEFLDQEWESLSKMFSFEDSDFLSSCNNNNNMFSNHGEIEISPSFFSNDDQSLFFTSDHNNSNNSHLNVNHHASFYCASQESSNSTGETEHPLFSNAVDFLEQDDYSMDFCNMKNESGLMAPAVFSDDRNVMEEILQLRAEIYNIDQSVNAGLVQNGETGDSCKGIQMKRKQNSSDQDLNSSDQNTPKKKARVSKNNAAKNKRNTKKNKKATNNNDEEMENNMNEQSSSMCSSEEGDSNASQQELANVGSTSESKGKGKISNKGPATDPQSLYARKRRERINERLKTLQNLVPNGTKVDISTMLEEAVHYVKFLQLQIKLLSSDDLWMYAPIAYNGMDMGLYQKIVPNLWS